MSTTYVVGVRVDGNATSFMRAARQAEQATRSMGNIIRSEFSRIQQAWQSTQGRLASLGLGVGLAQMQRNAAQLQKSLTQVRLTAGMSVQEQEEAYRRLFDMVRRNGGVLEDTLGGFNNLIQAGLKYQEAINATEAISIAKPVTGASDQALSGALTVGAANFNFDLSKTGVATRMLDEMAVAGRLGNAELENLSDIFARVAQRAQSAGMSFQTTLAFIEGLSQIERQPERLATLADSTLRLFTNAHYAKDAEKATGVRFFAKNGSRRDSIAVMEELRQKYQKLTTDAQRFQFINKAFGKADLDTQRGLSALLGGNGLQNIREFERLIKNAGGTLERDLPDALNNAVDQSSRLKNTLREAAEEFARPINDSISRLIRYGLDSKDKGGVGLSGGQVMGGAAVASGAIYMTSRFLPGILRSLVGRAGGVSAGVATGKALEAAAGVTPVYVTNWAEMNGGGAGSSAATAAAGAASGAMLPRLLAAGRMLGGVSAGVATGKALEAAAGVTPVYVTNWAEMNGGGAGSSAATAAAGAASGAMLPRLLAAGRMLGGVGVAAAGGYAVGTLISKAIEGTSAQQAIGRAVAKTLAFFGNQEAATAVAQEGEAGKRARLAGESDYDRAARVFRRNSGASEELERVFKRSEVKGEVKVRILTVPGISAETDVMFTNPRIPFKADVGRTNLAAGF